MRVRGFLAAALCAVLGMVPQGVATQAHTVQVAAEGTAWAVRVNGHVVLRLRGHDSAVRAQAVAARLRYLPRGGQDVQVVPEGGSVGVYAAGRRIVSVGWDQARANRTSPYGLATRWAIRLQSALSERRLFLPTTRLVLPVGASRLVEVRTLPPGQPQVGPYDDRVVRVGWEGPQQLRVVARSAGTSRIPIRYGPNQREIQVWVRPVAGRLPDRVEAVVTGDPAPAEVVREAAVRAVERAVRAESGAVLEVTPGEIPALRPGEVWWGGVPTRVRSPFALPVEGRVPVVVRNQALPLAWPSRLLVSNNPERIVTDGVLFREVIPPGESVRMLYHHANGAGRDKVLTVRLRNLERRPARVHLQLSTPPAWHDTMGVGHAAARRFLELVAAGAGYVLELPPLGEHRFSTQRTPPGHVISGLAQLQVLQGGPLEVSVSVRTVYVLDRAVWWELGPDEQTHPRGTFGPPLVEVEARLQVGSEWAALVGHSRQLRDLKTGTVLQGDYGVTWRLRLLLENPTEQPAEGELVVVAASGPAYATFLVDGQLVDLKYLAPGRSTRVFSTTLAPGEVRPLELVTIPEAASWYPIRLEWRAR